MTWLRPPGPVAKGLRIGLFGGSFNPAHEGHRYVAEIALKQLGLSYVWWLVSPQNPLKSDPASLAKRLAAARAVVDRHPRMIVTDVESTLGTRYTIDTLKALHRRFPEVRFVWLMGSDNLEQFHRWRRWTEIAALVPIAVVERPGSILAPLRANAMQRFARHRGRMLNRAPALVVLDGRRNEASATAIRALGAREAGMLE
ncbi:MAG: nicotinate-nucleotide adenylyltransferase [Alphaproteobacteria bacterium]|nr:nicotinate-nucleotide adenylyltransferase [Alphaproteobacteria bacterium]MDE1986020.1 nicotinate-nucleotide adenylyltransferase [Alphaproteobacteria bacterium]MDE2164033.1 nicotinate-nucleotide adenylyltransferase [Alphaproteobacteria bacterium]MDE2266346.1 nicotinate-nucleotide adenylyltransferase [Alphaproteobacteria bacterium]MDE2499623.1 nicotinate-nucleotide adenylyltransferase [Alphaproteobacteria bacterium]